MKTTDFPATLEELYQSSGFDIFRESKLGNDLFISDPDRANRIHEAAEHGAEGSTHAEIMEDWREYLDQLKDEHDRHAWSIDDEAAGDAYAAEIQTLFDSIAAEIDNCEAWHEANGSLHEEAG